MNETIRTLIFVGVAAVAAIAAFAARPNLTVQKLEEVVNQPLFPNFTDPLAAKSLEITQYDEATARRKQFTVAQQADGRWVIPSHGNYPADAEAQLRAAAESVIDLKAIGVMGGSDTTAEHGRLGVISPERAEVGTEGVGTLIAIQDGKGNDLLRLIVGKADATQPELRFVRKPSEDIVYVAEIDLTKLPTEFDKWIEKDLLKISTFDVARVSLKDYLLVPTQSGRLAVMQRMDAALDYDSAKGEWALDSMTVQAREGAAAGGLGEHEELNKQKLDELRSALGDLKIVNVARKPGNLGNALSVNPDQLTQNEQDALREFGFYPQGNRQGKLDIYGANGEVHIDTKDGVQYVLRFGDIAPQIDLASGIGSGEAGATDEDQLKVHRYLFVTTRVSPNTLKAPELTPEPAGPEPAGDAADPLPPPAEENGNAAETDDPDDPEAKARQAQAVDPQQAERERIRRENERKMNDYRDQQRKAEQRVTELNARFGNWYYVVSEDVYKKIRLVRSDIVKEAATAAEEGFGIDAFRKLEGEGLSSGAPE
jgi:hypothetical protein